MTDLTRGHESEAEEHQQAAARSPGSALPAGIGAVLAMQRSAGNAAVVRALGAGRAPGAGAALARLITGDPGNLPAAPGTAHPGGTRHAAPTIADAANHQAPRAAAGVSVSEYQVSIRARATSPFIGDSPTEEDLFERHEAPTSTPAEAPAMTSSLQTVTDELGSISQPVVHQEADNSLFIDPGPKAQDVQQGFIGDCWNMSTIIGVVNRDPGKITAMMQPDSNGGATVTFYRRQVTPPSAVAGFFGAGPTTQYVTEQVAVSRDLAFDVDAADASRMIPRSVLPGGATYGSRINGAQLRAAPTPKESRWWAVVNGTTLEIHKLEIYQMARWSPLLEKAGARFSEVHGQYGRGGSAGGEKTDPNQGYANLESGSGFYALTMFYGEAGERLMGLGNTTWSPTQAAGGAAAFLQANSAVMERLIPLNGRARSHQAGDRTAPIVTAVTTGEDEYLRRLAAQIPVAQADPDWANVQPPTPANIATLVTAISNYQTAPADPASPAPPLPNGKGAMRTALIAAARAAALPANNPTLISDARSSAIKSMVDLILVVKNFGSDSGSRTQSVYPGHVYSVLQVNLVDTTGTLVNFTGASASQRATLYGTVDPNRSQILIMNPHHAGVPDAAGTSTNDTGEFSMSLERFLRMFLQVTGAELQI